MRQVEDVTPLPLVGLDRDKSLVGPHHIAIRRIQVRGRCLSDVVQIEHIVEPVCAEIEAVWYESRAVVFASQAEHAVFDIMRSAVYLSDQADLRNMGALFRLVYPDERATSCLDPVGELHQAEGVRRRAAQHDIHFVPEFGEASGLATHQVGKGGEVVGDALLLFNLSLLKSPWDAGIACPFPLSSREPPLFVLNKTISRPRPLCTPILVIPRASRFARKRPSTQRRVRSAIPKDFDRLANEI